MPYIDQHILDRLDAIISILEKATGDYSAFTPERQKYYNTITQVETPGTLAIKEAAETTFYNNGTSNFVVNNCVLAPGQGLAFEGNDNEVDTTRYTYSFQGAGNNIGWILQKLYV
jgi:hypothetical protein